MKEELTLCQNDKNLQLNNLNGELNVSVKEIEKPTEPFTNEIKSGSEKKALNDITKTNSNFYVYGLKHPSTGEIFYIGKGKNRRCQFHVDMAKTHDTIPKGYTSSKLFNKIKSLLREGHSPIVEMLYVSLPESVALLKEIELIKQYGRENLCNLTDGGDGISGYKFSKESKKRMSLARKGHKMNATTRNALRIANVGRKMKPEWTRRQVLSQSDRVYYIVNHNTGETYQTRNLKGFCREHMLKSGTMMQTYQRKRKTLAGANAGWELINIITDLEFMLQPDVLI